MEEARWVLSNLLRGEGVVPVAAANGEEALTRLRHQSFNVVLLDVRLPDMDGLAVLTHIKGQQKDVPVIMFTGYGTPKDAVRLLKAGAYDYLTKPFNNDEALGTIRRALETSPPEREFRRFRDEAPRPAPLSETMGSSHAVRDLMVQVARVAPTNFSVLITGETGVGKELVARAVHGCSARAGRAFVTVDCGAIPETLIENELFGHEKGAFTGADRAMAGAFELAPGGTLFLDEIGNLPLPMQAKLLQAIDERRIQRLGSGKTLQLDLRILAATNEDLHAMVERRTFRRDLYHRLVEFTISVPPLRERKEDLPFLVKRFLDLTNQELGKSVRGLQEAAWNEVQLYDWPGNVRELRNVVRRAVLLADSKDELITSRHLTIGGPTSQGHGRYSCSPMDCSACGDGWSLVCAGLQQDWASWLSKFGTHPPLKEAMRRAAGRVEYVLLNQALQQAKGNKAEAARLLHVDYKTVLTKLKAHSIFDPVRSEEGAVHDHQAQRGVRRGETPA
ncbi:MAG: sigma-54-dependent Fis family transcriptional regulator [Acidobacteria bacterium]|nr:sigma-54-dependent Fis family transcriptional regulator [Acidobacteriota bacterium]